MSRSGYTDDCNPWALITYRGQVASAIRGKRGQKLLRELKAALEAMPERRLIANALACREGVCALGALGQQRGLDLDTLDTDPHELGDAFGVAWQLAAEIMHENDDWHSDERQRWKRMHRWVCGRIRE